MRTSVNRTRFFTRLALVLLVSYGYAASLLRAQFPAAWECARAVPPAAAGLGAVDLFDPAQNPRVSVTDPNNNMRITDCKQDGPPLELYIGNSPLANPVAFHFESTCEHGVGKVRIRFCGLAGGTLWRAFDSAGNLLDADARPGGGPQWVGLDGNGECIDHVTVVGQEICVIAVCWECKEEDPDAPDGGGGVFGGGFIRGDSNDDGFVNLGDPVYTMDFLFTGGPVPDCDDAADANDDGAIDLSDSAFTLVFLFLGGPPPPAPYPNCGSDPTADAIGCVVYNFCP